MSHLNAVCRRKDSSVAELVAEGSRGHFPEADHIALIAQVKEILPPEAKVMFLGDGEFEGIDLQKTLSSHGIGSVAEPRLSTIRGRDGETLTFEELDVWPGTRIIVPDTTITREEYGPVQPIAWWDEAEGDPLYLISNLSRVEDPCDGYKLRFTIETLFSDQKSRGFHLHKSHISDTQRLAQLMMAAGLASIFLIYLGNFARQHGYDRIIHRTDRCDLSLFQLGLRFLHHCLNPEMEIPHGFSQLESAHDIQNRALLITPATGD